MNRTKEYYIKAWKLIPKASRHGKMKLAQQLAIICAVGQLKGFIPLPDKNPSEYLKIIQNKYGYLLNT